MADPVVDLEMLIRTRHAIVTLETVEEAFATRCILEAAGHLDLGVMEWTATDGLHRISPTPLGIMAGTETFKGGGTFLVGYILLAVGLIISAVVGMVTALRPKIDDIIGCFYNIHIVLDYNYRIALVNKTSENIE